MKEDKEKWIEDILESAKEINRAKPNPNLFTKIEHRINALETKVISMQHWRFTAVAAILLLILNIYALDQYISMEKSVSEKNDVELISNYKLYD